MFETDDGSLPEVRVDYANPAATVAGYALLRTRASVVVTDSPTFWSNTRSAPCAVDSVPNAAALVVSAEAEAFHLVLGGIQVGGVTIPDLGVFVFPKQLTLDYRMGPAWGPPELEAMFGLLAELSSLDPSASLALEERALPEIADRFERAWRRWGAERRTR